MMVEAFLGPVLIGIVGGWLSHAIASPVVPMTYIPMTTKIRTGAFYLLFALSAAALATSLVGIGGGGAVLVAWILGMVGHAEMRVVLQMLLLLSDRT